MKAKQLKAMLCSAALATGILTGAFAVGADAVKANTQAPTQPQAECVENQPAPKGEKKEIKRLRGQLLYKQGQIRKLERAAATADSALGARLEELQRQRRELLVAAEPKLVELYAAEAELQGKINAATGK